jgi:hypothetical protein
MVADGSECEEMFDSFIFIGCEQTLQQLDRESDVLFAQSLKYLGTALAAR